MTCPQKHSISLEVMYFNLISSQKIAVLEKRMKALDPNQMILMERVKREIKQV